MKGGRYIYEMKPQQALLAEEPEQVTFRFSNKSSLYLSYAYFRKQMHALYQMNTIQNT